MLIEQAIYLKCQMVFAEISGGLYEQILAVLEPRTTAPTCGGEGGRLLSRPTGEDRHSSYLFSSIAKCVTCGGSIVAIKRTAKRRYTRTVYRCAYHHKRGSTVCSNNLEVRQNTLVSAILHAMNDALDERVLVVAALERIRNKQEKFPDQRVVLERELSLLQMQLHHLVETIASGKSTDSVIASLHQEEARRELWFKNYRDLIASLKWSPSMQSDLLKTSEAA